MQSLPPRQGRAVLRMHTAHDLALTYVWVCIVLSTTATSKRTRKGFARVVTGVHKSTELHACTQENGTGQIQVTTYILQRVVST